MAVESLNSDKWTRDEDLEKAFYNSMVGKEVDAFSWANYFMLVRKTKMSCSVSVYRTNPPKSKSLVAIEEELNYEDLSDVANSLVPTDTECEALEVVLETKDVPQGELQEELGWDSSKTSRVVSSLEDKGYVTRSEEGRSKTVHLV